ncbi:MAG: tryptophan 7-halogenase [Myxococcota bacterium]
MEVGSRYDVAIVGAGKAGALIARHLRREQPGLSVVLVEQAKRALPKVGESTVEIASNYLVRRLGLSRYLYERHLPKNGLRFFFDRSTRDGSLEQLSEIGSRGFPAIPSFQIDRAHFEGDLRRMNEADGVTYVQGRVEGLSLGAKKSRFEVRDDVGGRREMTARWVVDASGRAGIIARKLELRRPRNHALTAMWGRFEGVADLDDYGADAFRARVNHVSRTLSTNHFCYPGYWIWFIPLGAGKTSVGLVIERDRWGDRPKTAEMFIGFLEEHAAVKALLSGAARLDYLSYDQLAYGTSQFFGAGWATVGEAAAFPDPLYSPGSDFIAVANDLTVDLIRREARGEDVGSRRTLYDRFMVYRYEATMALYEGLYPCLGSYELYRLKWDLDLACYYDLWLEPYLMDQHLDAGWLENQLKQAPLVLGLLRRFGELFRRAYAQLHAEGRLDHGNLHAYDGSFAALAGAGSLGTEDSSRRAVERAAKAFNRARQGVRQLLGEDPGEKYSLRHFLANRAPL